MELFATYTSQELTEAGLLDGWGKLKSFVGTQASGGRSKTGTGSYTGWGWCRHDASMVFKITGGVEYWAGSAAWVETQPFDGLTVSLTGDDRPPTLGGTASWRRALAGYVDSSRPETVVLAWPDMGTPPVRPGFWRALYEQAKQRGVGRVLLYCTGGHGRTGTALAATLIEVCDYTAEDAVAYVRKAHCTSAVETEGQLRYLASLDRRTKSEPPPAPEPAAGQQALTKVTV